jgi:hypothetical protein
MVRDKLLPKLIVIDEAARATESKLWLLLDYYRPRGYIFISDYY